MIKKYVEENEARMLEELFSLIRIPSVSAQPAHKEDMVRCAERWKELLLAAGVDKAEVMPSKGNPMVYAEKIIDPKAKTILVYGHYDVMPAEPFDLWKTEPLRTSSERRTHLGTRSRRRQRTIIHTSKSIRIRQQAQPAEAQHEIHPRRRRRNRLIKPRPIHRRTQRPVEMRRHPRIRHHTHRTRHTLHHHRTARTRLLAD